MCIRDRHGADPGEALKDEEGMEVAARLGRDMAWMVKVLAESRVPVPERDVYKRQP